MSGRDRIELPDDVRARVKEIVTARTPGRFRLDQIDQFVIEAVEVAVEEARRLAARRADRRRSLSWSPGDDAKVTGAEWECEGCARPRDGPGVKRCVRCGESTPAVQVAHDPDTLRTDTRDPTPRPNPGDTIPAGTKHGSAPSRRQIAPDFRV